VPAGPPAGRRAPPGVRRPGSAAGLVREGWVGVRIELADAVAVVRAELLEAAARGAGGEVGFAVGPIELEFAVELRADARARAGFAAWVLTAEAEAQAGRTSTHRVRLTLRPTRGDGGDVWIAAAGSGVPTAGDGRGHLGR
jgi:Trypsin-co-occurring domain 2